MPFKSEKQRRYLWANEPKIAREWTDRYGASEGGITRLRQAYPNNMTVGEEMINIGTGSGNALDNQTAFLPSDKRHNILRTLDNQVQEGLFMNEQNKKQYEDLLRQDKEGVDKGEWEYSLPEARYVSANNIMSDANIVDGVDVGIEEGTVLPHGNFPIPDTMDIWGNRRIADEKLDYPPQSLFREGINQIDNWGKTGLNIGQAALNWAGDKLIGIPGVGFMAGLLQSAGRPDSPYQKEMKKIMGVSGNKDPWGKNIRSFADNYDITDQWDKFAGSKLGQKYGLETLGVDGLTDQEIAQLEAMGLKGYQLNRAKQLSAYNKQAMAWKRKRDEMIMKREDEARRIRKEKAAKEKAEREQAALRQQVRQQAEANKQAGTGGYQSSFGKDEGFMGGSGTSDDMGSFAEGGLAGLWHRK